MLQLAVFYPVARQIFDARRDAGYMREYLADHGIKKVLVLATEVDSQLAREQENIRVISSQRADEYEYIVVYCMYPSFYTKKAMDSLRPIKPVICFKNQESLRIIWYEFPQKKDFIDLDDELTNTRRLYRWRDVREILRPFLKPDAT